MGGVSLVLAGALVLRVPQPSPHLATETATAAT